MKTRRIFITFFIIITLWSCTIEESNKEKISEGIDLSVYKYQQTKDIVKLVNDAVELIQEEGKKAFPKFRKKNSKWFQGDTYIFVWGLDGMRYVYPRNPEGEGQNMINLKDVNGKPIGQMFVDVAKNKKGEGWVFYEWTKPDQDKPIWKTTYIKKAVSPSRKKYLVGCGLYDMKIEKKFIVDNVNNAVDLLLEEGLSAVDEIGSIKSPFIFQDVYIFINDIKGKEILNPYHPELYGTNLLDLQDANGKYFVRDEIEKLKNIDSCWDDYVFPKPGKAKPSKKLVFVRKVIIEGDTLIVGSGYYPEE